MHALVKWHDVAALRAYPRGLPRVFRYKGESIIVHTSTDDITFEYVHNE